MGVLARPRRSELVQAVRHIATQVPNRQFSGSGLQVKGFKGLTL